MGERAGDLGPRPPLPKSYRLTTSTAAPWIWPRRNRLRASLAASRGKVCTSVLTGTRGASLQKLLAVGPGQVGHRAHHPLPPEQVVGKRRDVAHVDAAADHDPALGRGPQGRGDERAHRRKNDGCVQFLRGQLVRAPGPHGPQPPGELLGLGVPRPGEGIDLFPLVHRDLDGDVGCGPEAVDPQPLPGILGHAVGAVADQPGAQKRRRLGVAIGRGQRKTVALVGDGVFGVASVQGVAGEPGVIAQVLPAMRGSSGRRRRYSPATAPRGAPPP